MNLAISQQESHEASPSRMEHILLKAEAFINKIPHPVTVIFMLNIVLLTLSAVMAWLQIGVVDPRPVELGTHSLDGMIYVVNLLSVEGVYLITSNMLHVFTNSGGLGTILVVFMGVGIANGSGLLAALMKVVVMGIPARILTVVIMLIGVMTNISSELGYVIFIPLAAVAFQAAGRHPIAGIAAAFAAVSGGYTANVFLGRVDPVLATLTEKAAKTIDPAYVVGPEMNWYFTCASIFLITMLGTWVTERIVEPRLGVYQKDGSPMAATQHSYSLTQRERHGLRAATITFMVITLFMVFVATYDGTFLHRTELGDVVHASFMEGLVAFIFVLFALPGLAYGIVAGSIKNESDVIAAMASKISTLGIYIVLVFLASHFAAFFKWSNIGLVMSGKLLEVISVTELPAPFIFFSFILASATLNLFIGSEGIKWAVFAPVFVPAFMMMGFSPELTQLGYRVGDSVTNIITPMLSYFGITLALAISYNKNLSIGTFIATMLPYSMFFFVGWSILLFGWVFVFNLPIGPGATSYYNVAG